MVNQKQILRKKRQPWLLLILFLIFLVPMILAWLLYEEGDKGISKTVNRGQLIQPPIAMSQLALKDLEGQAYDQKSLRGKWLMLYISPTPQCQEDCQKKLYFMRQIQIATGKDMDRIQRVMLTLPKQKPDPHLEQLLQTDFAGTTHLLIAQKDFQKGMQSSATTTLAMTQGYLYLVDPLGNIMMGYPMAANPSDIFKDLRKLLKVSQIG